MQKLLRPIFKSQGGLNVKRKPNASQDVVKFKILISSWACSVDIEECTTKARKWFKEWKSTPQKNPYVTLIAVSVQFVEFKYYFLSVEFHLICAALSIVMPFGWVMSVIGHSFCRNIATVLCQLKNKLCSRH